MLKPIKNDTQYENALAQVYELMQNGVKANSEESHELEVWSILNKAYENAHYPVPKPSPIEAIKFRLEQMNMSETELSQISGNRSRKSEILSGKRKLNLSMVRKLVSKLNIPADLLIQAY
jgi:HTH-type transcriptional regulator/antitoxin HigA